MTDDEKPRLEIDWIKAFGGALAAVSTAVMLSTLGAAGTLIGAALGSLALTISSAFYSQGLARSRHRIAVAQKAAQSAVESAQSQVRRAGRTSDEREVEGRLGRAEEDLDEARAELAHATDEPDAPTVGHRLALLPWKKIALVAAGFFLAAMLVITAFELIAGRTVSSITGGTDSKDGTTISRVTGSDSSNDSPKDQQHDDETTPSSDPTTSESPSADPSTDPSATASTTPTESSSSEPSTDPSPTTSAEPTEEPTSSPTAEAAPAE
ncbi:hypothetical protein [Nocardioides sp. Root140]|uniref:hypothetical protein n=1 Tax=Nocardioides sp. Root140 TaxID=1736460 RepID=UPI0006F371C1|nr:hypothetical protein [Nocardioides sp. Root140]KQY57521.1 hypothetical protein ASD30_15155 [Nocardioides sp. Root140]